MQAKSFAVVALMLMTCATVACRREEVIQKSPTLVGIHVVDSTAAGGAARYSGNIEPYTQVTLAFKVSGYIEKVYQVRGVDGRMRNIQEGDLVKQGTILANVRDKDYAERVSQAKANLAQSQARAEKAKLDFDRASALIDTQSLTKPDFDAAKAARDVGLAAVQGARAQLAEAETALADCALKTPMDGIVLSRKIELGSFVGPSTPGFVVADARSVRVLFGVPDVLVGSFRIGAFLPLTTESIRGKQFRGQITNISPAADPKSRVFEVELTVANSLNELKPGMIASLEVPGQTVKNPVFGVPLAAIVRPSDDPSGYAVFVVEVHDKKQVARLRNVKLGEAYGNFVAVSEGLRFGESVIVVGAPYVQNGEEVHVIP
ncbi:MAG TPA: efflux RND transporter periplasmic adaptor subunit [Terriglobia bacterium]|nr:efflux RND transporter periplasmic adaptor subunit [Terriglobia bacterium]